MARKVNRRTFLAESTAATAATLAAKPLAAYGSALRPSILPSPLLPAQSRGLFDVARNRAAYQSSAIDENCTAHLVTDGSTNTLWESQPGGLQWIAIDLGHPRPIDRLTIRWGAMAASTYSVQVAPEPATHPPTPSIPWTQVFATTNGQGGVEHIPLHGVHAAQIRILAHAPSPTSGVSIASVEAWSPDNPNPAPPPPTVLSLPGSELSDGWSLQAGIFTESSPHDISSPSFAAPGWLPAVVPATVLTSYLRHGSIPDPFYGDQQTQVSDSFFTNSDFWYRNTFVIPREARGHRLWLNFDGINWKADVWLNGHFIGRIAGAFIRSRFDITAHAIPGARNCVAVLIRRVEHPGHVRPKVLAGEYRNGGDLGLDSPTFIASVGWNWLPTIRGRNTGIWNHVRFESTGDVTLHDPWISTESLAPDLSHAHLALHATLTNHSTQPRRCLLRFSSEVFSGRHEVALAPGETTSVTITSTECPSLSVAHPRLWWPNGYGEPALHNLHLAAEIDGVVSHEQRTTFGIRKIDYTTPKGVLTIHINHCRILCRGGNWGMDEGMLRCDAAGYDLRVRMHRDMHLNMIRNWIGMVGRDEFYDACDRYGILVWDDFWIANPVDAPDPSDHPMFLANAFDKIRRIRRHPSLALYCGRNEGDPPPDIDAALRAAATRLDGTRYYIPNSAAGLVTGHGPYTNQDPAWYFAHRGTTFHSEQGIVCVPAAESIRAMMPAADQWPISDTWATHDYQRPRSELNTQRIEQRYGPATSLDGYCRKAQLVNLETAKAIYESLQTHQGSGQLIWMTQSAWPAMICQLYDYYFDQTAACFGAKTACRPIHILWDQHTGDIRIANNTPAPQQALRAEARIFTLHGREVLHRAVTLDIPATAAVTGFPLNPPSSLSGVFFVKLTLHRAAKLLSDNFYWSPTSGGDCTSLSAMPRAALHLSAQLRPGAPAAIHATVRNPGNAIAFAIRLQLQHGPRHERLLPAFYQDNYFSLLPGESRTVAIELPSHELPSHGLPSHAATPTALRLAVDGWNIAPAHIPIA